MCAVALTVLSAMAASAAAPSPNSAAPACVYYGGHVDLDGKLGNRRDIGEMAVFLPVACSRQTLLFTDLRAKLDSADNREGNLGLGVRTLREAGVLGGYVYLDRRMSGVTNKYHTQATLGADWLTENWELGGNAYLPLSGEKSIGVQGGSSTPFLAGSGIFVHELATNILRERSLYGGDAEIGFKLPDTRFWLHGGAFVFDGEDAPSIIGGRARATWELSDYVALTAEGQYDDERGRQGWLGARLTLPFGGPSEKPQGVATRMTASPVRDVDIVTHATVRRSGEDRTVDVLNTATGDRQRVLYVDNTSAGGGDGTLENPFNTLAAAEAELADNDILYIHTGVGTTGMDNGLLINRDGVQVIGAGADFLYDGAKLTTGSGINPDNVVLIARSTAPTLTNTGTAHALGDGISISGRNTTLAGVAVEGAQRNGILAYTNAGDLGDLTITDVTSTGNALNGIHVGAALGGTFGQVTLDNVQTDENAYRGFFLVSDGNGSRIDKVVAVNMKSNRNNGTSTQSIIVVAQAGGVIQEATLRNIEANGNKLNGVFVWANGGEIGTLTLDTIETNENQSHGMWLYATNAGTIGRIVATGLESNRNTRHGIGIGATRGGQITEAALTKVEASDNDDMGIQVYAISEPGYAPSTVGTVALDTIRTSGNASTGLIVQGNSGSTIDKVTAANIESNGNGGFGVRVHAANGGEITQAALEAVQAVQNVEQGFYVSSDTGGILRSVSLRNSELTYNGRDGVYLNDDSTGAFSVDLNGGNRIFGNGTGGAAYRDLRLDLDGGSVDARNNWWGQEGGPLDGRIVNEAACPQCGTPDISVWLDADPRP